MRINTRNTSQALYYQSAYLRYTEFPTNDDARPLTSAVGTIVWPWLEAYRSRYARGPETLLDENSGSRSLGSACLRLSHFVQCPTFPRGWACEANASIVVYFSPYASRSSLTELSSYGVNSHARLDTRLYLSQLRPILAGLACPLPSGLGGVFGRPTPTLSFDLSYCSLT